MFRGGGLHSHKHLCWSFELLHRRTHNKQIGALSRESAPICLHANTRSRRAIIFLQKNNCAARRPKRIFKKIRAKVLCEEKNYAKVFHSFVEILLRMQCACRIITAVAFWFSHKFFSGKYFIFLKKISVRSESSASYKLIKIKILWQQRKRQQRRQQRRQQKRRPQRKLVHSLHCSHLRNALGRKAGRFSLCLFFLPLLIEEGN